MIPARAGQKENRYVQLLSGEPDLESWITAPAPPAPASEKARIDTLESELGALKSEFRSLREDLDAFKKSFG
jgi:uncharacterized protein YceH (UPF0502 family)